MKNLRNCFLMFLFFITYTPWALSQRSFVQGDSELAEGLIRSFNAFCPTNGSWTLNALGEVQKIQSVLESLRDDPNCVDAAKIVTTYADNLNHALGRINGSVLERNILSKQKQQAEIILLLEGLDNESEKRSLESAFLQNQLNISSNKGMLEYNEAQAQDQYLTNVIVNSATNILQQVSLNRRCLLQTPQLISSFSSIGPSISSALITGGASLGLAATSGIIGHVLEFVRKFKLDRHIQRLGQSTFITAYQCVLESLSNQWCEAQETYDLIDLKIKNQFSHSDSFSTGIRILNRDLPIFSDWLNKVRSATQSESRAVSINRKIFLNRENALEVWKEESLGNLGDIIRKLPKTLDTDKDREEQFYILKTFVRGNIPTYTDKENENRVNNPIYDLISQKHLPWFLAGIPVPSIPEVTNFSGPASAFRF